MGSNQSTISPFIRFNGLFISYEQIYSRIEQGDLIEIKRNLYNHWVLVHKKEESNVWCYHITGAEEKLLKGWALLKYEPLFQILKDNDSCVPSLCRINNQNIMSAMIVKTTKRPDIRQVFEYLHRNRDSLMKYNLKVSYYLFYLKCLTNKLQYIIGSSDLFDYLN